MITEDYVSFEIAKLLKEKGFNEPCRAIYSPKGVVRHFLKEEVYRHSLKGHKKLCPTHQMAMAWLKEVHNIVIVIDVCRETGREGFYCWQLEDSRTGDWIVNIIGECPTYEQACEGALKYCLENLI